jgi:hypothetical protein
MCIFFSLFSVISDRNIIRKQDEFILFNTIGQSLGSQLLFDHIEENLKELIEKYIIFSILIFTDL